MVTWLPEAGSNEEYFAHSAPYLQPLDEAQKKPHGSFEVECGSSEHDVEGVSEKIPVEVSSKTMVALAMSDDWLYARSLSEQFVFLGSHVFGVGLFGYVWNLNSRAARHLLPPVSSVASQSTYLPAVYAFDLLHRLVNRMSVILIPERERSDDDAAPQTND